VTEDVMEKVVGAKVITAKIISAKVINDRVMDDRVPDNRDSDGTAPEVKAADAKSTDVKIAQMKTAIVSAIDAIDAKDRVENAADGDQDRREVTRTRVLRGAKIIVQARSPVVHCTVQNITSAGACLKLANTWSIPDSFELTFEHGRTRRACRVAWRTDDMLGVAFVDDQTPAEA
jgi:hypothetical protein